MDACRFDILGHLPPELVIKVVDYLDLKALLSSQAVSRTWFTLLNFDIVWKRYLHDGCPNKEVQPRKDFRWMVMLPCEAKLKLLNHKRVVKNWLKNKYKRHEVKGTDTSFASAYDGKTLLISIHYPTQGLSVYRVERGKLWLQQFIKIEGVEKCDALATNTNYIAAQCGPHTLIYHFASTRKKSYKIAYVLCRGFNDGTMKKIGEPPKANSNHKCVNDPLEAVSFCLLDDTLFVYYLLAKSLYAWNMDKQELILHKSSTVSSCGFLTDGKQVYTSSFEMVSVFDSQADLQYTIQTKNFISKMLVNDNLVVVLHNESFAGYCKFTGSCVLTGNVGVSPHSLLHPRKDVLFDITDNMEVYAVELKTDYVLWSRFMSDVTQLGNLHSVAGDDCLLVTSFSGYDCEFHDSKTGIFLYNSEADGIYVSTHYDLMIYFNRRTACAIVHVYS
uniref:Putative E3 ubiquitin ligase complex SCF subunit sconB n=1 Tax=Lygus hesperus TaxID=30085 RepID=A0A0A9YX00_LYGHE